MLNLIFFCREEDHVMRPAPKAEGRKKKKGKVQRARDDDQAAPSASLKQPSRPPATRKAGSQPPNSPRASTSNICFQGSCRAWPTRLLFLIWRLLVWYPRVLWANQGWGQGQARALLGLLLVVMHRSGTRSLGASPPMSGECLHQHCACELI